VLNVLFISMDIAGCIMNRNRRRRSLSYDN